MERYKYRNTKTADLWNSLFETSGVQVANMMDTWATQTGFPIVSVEMIQDGGGNTTAINLTQRRYVCHQGTGNNKCAEQFWIVPVTVCAMNDPSQIIMKVVMERHGRPQTFTLPKPERGFVRINPGAIGYYHVQYHETIIPALISALSVEKFGPSDRLSLLDMFTLVFL